jgi:hypothetical protein
MRLRNGLEPFSRFPLRFTDLRKALILRASLRPDHRFSKNSQIFWKSGSPECDWGDMTSFLHLQTSSTGSQVPGGAFGTAGEQGMGKLVAPLRGASPAVPTSFQITPARLSGGTVAQGERHATNGAGGLASWRSKPATVCQASGAMGSTPARRGTGWLSAQRLFRFW